MKAILRTVFVLMLVVSAVACGNKKKSGARFEDRGARAAHVTQRQAQVGISTVVYGIDQTGQYRSYSNWMSSVKRFASASVTEQYIGNVSQDGANKTGVFFGARLCINRYQSSSIPTQAMVVAQIYDDASDQPIPIYLNAVQGGVYNASTGQLNAIFSDQYGSIRLAGTVSGQTFSGWVIFDTRLRADNNTDTQGEESLGTVYMNADQLFSCY